MATLKKVTITEWRDVLGKRVKPQTPGAKKVTIKSKKWYIVYKEHGRVKRLPAYTDKKASQAKLADFLKAKERGESGLSDPYKLHYDRPILEHIEEYHNDVAAHSRSEKHPAEVLRILKANADGMKVTSIREITPGRVTVRTYAVDVGRGWKGGLARNPRTASRMIPSLAANQLTPVVNRCHSNRTNARNANPMWFR